MSEPRKRNQKSKQYFSQMNKKKKGGAVLTLEAGLKGFFCTCNFQEKNCVREAYNILNEYADRMYSLEPATHTEACVESPEREDISDELQKQVTEMKQGGGRRFKRFQSISTSVSNCVFIKADIDNVVELGYSIVKDIAETKCQKTRYLLRIVPIEATCNAKIGDIISTAGKLFDLHFLGEPTTFSIVFNRRYNNSISREDVIKELAQLVTSKNCNHKADLTKAKHAIIVEVIKGMCLLSVVPDYFLNKKYNLFELCNQQTANKGSQKAETKLGVEEENSDGKDLKSDEVEDTNDAANGN